MSTRNSFRVLLVATLLGSLSVSARVDAAERAAVVDQLVAALCGKRVAVLAELPSHGEARAFKIKADVARGLVERCGFDAIFFEAPIYDFLGVDAHWGRGLATPIELDNAIGRFWLSDGLLEWRQWIFRRADGGRLVVGGIDDQVSITSEHARAVLPGLIASKVGRDKAGVCRASVDRNLMWSYDAGHPFDDTEKSLLRTCAKLSLTTGGPAEGASINQMMTANFQSYVERQIDPVSARSRDEIMFRNALWYFKRLPRDAKVIVWTATVHAAKKQGRLASSPLGERLDERWRRRVGTIGFTAFSGRSSMAGGPVKYLQAAARDSLEERAVRQGGNEIYLDRSSLQRLGVVESRLLGKAASSDWSEMFDGVVVIREEQAATVQASD